MKIKNMKLMLASLIAMMGVSNASAQELSSGSTLIDDYYKYTLKSTPVAVVGEEDTYSAIAELTEIRSGRNPVQADGSLYLVGNQEITLVAETYKIKITTIASAAPLQNLLCKSVVIPAELTAIPKNCFNGCTDLKDITFETGSQVTSIGSHAFATTKITDFDFSPCVKLAELSDEVFVESSTKNNSYITKVTLPTAPVFKHINGAFKNLVALESIENLENSYIQEVIAEAFSNCKKLTKISLPKNLKYIDKAALKGSSISDLTIDVTSLLNLGGGTVNTSTYAWTTSAATSNLYGKSAVRTTAAAVTPLTKLTLKGELKGEIAKNAFAWCDGLNGTLDLTGVTFGTTATIAAEAFASCYAVVETTTYGINGVKIGNITDNQSASYTIAGDAFKDCDALTSVEIGNITTTNAIGAAAFGDQLVNVTIGTVKASDAAFAAGAFVWKDASGATLRLATASGQYLNSNDATTVIIPAGTFDMSAITTKTAPAVNPAIQIGEIRSKGGVFEAAAITVPVTIGSLTFSGNIAENGIDAALLSGDANLTAITFKGSIGQGGIATDAFANVTSIQTLNFDGLLAEKAVATKAFAFPASAAPETTYMINYSYASIPDYTVNPFEEQAFNAVASANFSTDRYILLNVASAALKEYYLDPVVGLASTDNAKFDIYLVKFYVPEEVVAHGFMLYQNQNAKSVAWGRYDLGSFTVEKGPDLSNPYSVTTAMKIPRFQKVQDEAATVKLTIYGVYTDENPTGGANMTGESTVYFVPLQVFNGNYEIQKSNTCPLIIRADVVDGALTDKDVLVDFTDGTISNNSVWSVLPAFDALRSFKKNTSGSVVTTQILWDRTDASTYDVWGTDEAFAARTEDGYAPKAVYSLMNPAAYQGVDVVKLPVSKDSGKVGLNWYYTFLYTYADATALARVVWMSEGEATAIFGVKNVDTKTANNVMYNLQGMQISAPTKGQIYIMNGKKYIAK